MPTSSFETRFEIKSRKAIKNLEHAMKNVQKLPHADIMKKINKGIRQFKKHLSRFDLGPKGGEEFFP